MHLGTRSPVKEAMFGRRKKDNGVSKEKNDEDELLKQMMMDPVQILEDFGRDPSLMAELAALGGEEALEDTLFASLSVPATAPRKLALGVLSPSSPGFPAEGEGEETGTETNILASDALNTRKGDRASGGEGGGEGREEGGEDLDERLDEDGVLDADLQDELRQLGWKEEGEEEGGGDGGGKEDACGSPTEEGEEAPRIVGKDVSERQGPRGNEKDPGGSEGGKEEPLPAPGPPSLPPSLPPSNDLEMARLQDAVRESKAKAVALKKENLLWLTFPQVDNFRRTRKVA
ncbi:hypothetical protein NSK_006186 [Nannochloropsis salina CCMP1776]|uniref:Uncharacterized protein n=1 Tax=Nannochloropsis salina CCMP1776 TaxID=1027361 RepID=A0A4D9D1I6_9STRA|nr:hypothetical protein NSK_006186 [Nannochloropsis salina CCMP1776]|eukprot:TFJ82508.1 hypothetical protein NSK_006186 [Nannochloropsis salina CCMP1776]